MHRVGQHVAHGRLAGKHGAEIEEPGLRFGEAGRVVGRHPPGDEESGEQRTQGAKSEGPAPIERHRQKAGDQEGERPADREVRGVKGDAPALGPPGEAVAQDLHARHVGAGQTDAGDEA